MLKAPLNLAAPQRPRQRLLRRVTLRIFAAGWITCYSFGFAETNLPGWLTQPLSLGDAIRISLRQNGNVLRAATDLEAAHGIAIQTKAIVLPKVRGVGNYVHNEAVENDPRRNPAGIEEPEDQWNGSIRIIQSVYEGGRMRSAVRTARLTAEQAMHEYESVVADTVLEVRTTYYDVLLAEQQVGVREASVTLLRDQLAVTRKQYDAGAVPHFDVLRGEVELANARPRYIRAKNIHRLAKNRLATLLGFNVPTNVWDDIPLTLTTKLLPDDYAVDLPSAIAMARARRPELAALRAQLSLQQERVLSARAGYKPSIGVFAGYGARTSEFRDDFYRDVSGAMAGVTMSWDIFDGRSTQGRVTEARARESKAAVALDDTIRRVEQEVRAAYSSFVEAREVLQSQEKVRERAEEAVRLASSRYEAGSGTQLDVLNAQTAWTDARTTQVEAARDFLVARARLERAIGLDVTQETTPVRDTSAPP